MAKKKAASVPAKRPAPAAAKKNKPVKRASAPARASAKPSAKKPVTAKARARTAKRDIASPAARLAGKRALKAPVRSSGTARGAVKKKTVLAGRTVAGKKKALVAKKPAAGGKKTVVTGKAGVRKATVIRRTPGKTGTTRGRGPVSRKKPPVASPRGRESLRGRAGGKKVTPVSKKPVKKVLRGRPAAATAKKKATTARARTAKRDTGTTRGAASSRKKPSRKTAEQKKWERYGHLIRFTKLRSKLYSMAPEEFGSYGETAALAKCILEKNGGRIPRSNEKLLLMLAECLPEVGMVEPGTGVPGEELPPAPEIDLSVGPVPPPPRGFLGDIDFYQIDEHIGTLPADYPFPIRSKLSVTPLFFAAEYEYESTFKPYVDWINMTYQPGDRRSGDLMVRFNIVPDEQYGWVITVTETEPSGFFNPEALPTREREAAEEAIEATGAPAGTTPAELEGERFERKQRERASLLAEKEGLLAELEGIEREIQVLTAEIRLYLDRKLMDMVKVTGEALSSLRAAKISTRTRINQVNRKLGMND